MVAVGVVDPMQERSYQRVAVSSTSELKIVPSASPPRVREAYAEFICRYFYDAFATLTWSKPAGREQVLRDFKTWLSTWMGNVAVSRGLARWVETSGSQAARLRGHWPNQTRKGHQCVVWVLGIEPHKSGRLHAHALLVFPECFGEVKRKEGWELWKAWHGWSRIEEPRSQSEVGSYVSKYVVKDRSELVFSPSFGAPSMKLAQNSG